MSHVSGSAVGSWRPAWLKRLNLSPVGLVAIGLVVAGLVLGTAVHKGFLILFAAGAFGPGILRQLGLIDDLDECQRLASLQAGVRAYLVVGVALTSIVVIGGWDALSLSNDHVPASTMLILTLVVYYASYCLSFWDTRKAVSAILAAFGLFWLLFVVMSHGDNPMTLLIEGLVVPGPFLAGAVLCRYWPRTVGVLLLAASAMALHHFNLLPRPGMEIQRFYNSLFVTMLIPLPLAIGGIALLASRQQAEGEPVGDCSEE